MDVQKERIRQKICDAVAQIWRKETGCTVPLCIEGTICVTPWHGRTSAFHTSMQIPGAYPQEVEEAVNNENPRKRRRLDSLEAGECLLDLGCAEEADLSSEEEEDEEESSSGRNKSPFAPDDNNNQSGIVDAETDDLEVSVKDEPCATDDSENNVDKHSIASDDSVESATSAESVCSGTERDTSCQEDVPRNIDEKNEEREDDSNVDSGVQDLSVTEARRDESPNTSQGRDSLVTDGQNIASAECDDGRATPTPLVVDLSQTSHQTPSQTNHHPATVQTAIRNMLSIKLAASSNNKTSVENGCGGSLHKSLLVANKNGITPPELMLSKGISVTPIVKTGKLVGISTPAAQNLPRHSTPISLSYSFNGKVIEKPLHSLLAVTSGSPSSTISAYIVSPRLEMPAAAAAIPLHPVMPVARSSAADSANVESSTDSVKNGGELKTYSCKHCHKKFLFKSKYQEHMPVHTSERPFQCTSCQRTYKYKYDLNVHLRTHQGIPTKSTICPVCTKKFQTNKLLRLHIVEDHKDQQEGMKIRILQPDENSNHSSAAAIAHDNSQDFQEAT